MTDILPAWPLHLLVTWNPKVDDPPSRRNLTELFGADVAPMSVMGLLEDVRQAVEYAYNAGWGADDQHTEECLQLAIQAINNAHHWLQEAGYDGYP